MRPIIVWFRQDLRLSDHPALLAAARTGAPIIPLYVLDDSTPGAAWQLGGASRWWLHGSLTALAADLALRGVRLVLRRGAALDVLIALAKASDAGAVYWTRGYEPWAAGLETALQRVLAAAGIEAKRFRGTLLHEPETIASASGAPYRVFTPFWRRCLQCDISGPVAAAPESLRASGRQPESHSLADWKLRPVAPDWAGGLRAAWTPGEAGAHAGLERFIDARMGDYAAGRDRPAGAGTSGLSPHLHFGEISPRQVWHAVSARAAAAGEAGAQAVLRQLGWREFCNHLLHHQPALPEKPLRSEFLHFPWQPEAAALRAWQRGLTGYPLVDAGMRELWHTGWMHNRVRMVTASFLVKHLLQPWQSGAAWFWDTLVDADLANNSAGWQWVAGCGTDASPYLRIFNPVLQGEKFDPQGGYVRRWVPELESLPDQWIHRPWEASSTTLAAAGVTLGDGEGATYPSPIVEHASARRRALAALAEMKARAGQ